MLGTLMVAAALAAPHAVETGKGLTLSDGDRYAAWVHGANVRVLDEETESTSSVPMPSDCRVPDALGDGQLAFVCGKELRLLDVAAKTWATVPASADLFNADSVSVNAVGLAWIEVTVDLGYHSPVYPAWIERATGRVVADDSGDLSRYPDLDAPELFAPLCSPLRRRRNPDWNEEEQFGPRWIAPDIRGTRALDVIHDKLVLRYCGSSRTTVVTRSHLWDVAFFSGARVSWIEQRPIPALEGRERGRGRVRTYDASTGRVRSWPVPGGVNPNLYVVHTRSHIFVDKLGSAGHTSRYAIDLSHGGAAARTRPDG